MDPKLGELEIVNFHQESFLPFLSPKYKVAPTYDFLNWLFMVFGKDKPYTSLI